MTPYGVYLGTVADQLRNALAPPRPQPRMPTGKTLLQGRPYVPSHLTDITKTWRQLAPKESP